MHFQPEMSAKRRKCPLPLLHLLVDPCSLHRCMSLMLWNESLGSSPHLLACVSSERRLPSAGRATPWGLYVFGLNSILHQPKASDLSILWWTYSTSTQAGQHVHSAQAQHARVLVTVCNVPNVCVSTLLLLKCSAPKIWVSSQTYPF